MNNFGPLDLDEHAAFWARDDERAGHATERVEFEIAGEKFEAFHRRAAWVREGAHGRDTGNYLYEIGANRALFAAGFRLFPLPIKISGEDYLRGSRAFRPFHPREAGRYGARIYFDGTGEWFYRTQTKNGDLGFLSQSPFRWMKEPTSIDFLKLPPAEFLELCSQSWNSPDSEMRQSHEFDQLTLAARDAQVLRCENGDADELHRLINLLAHLIWSEANRLDFQFETGEENIVWLDLRSDELFEFGDHESARFLDRVYKAWRAAILRVLQPRYIGQKLPLHIKYWLGQGRHALEFVVESPTHHEQLEAHLQLRDWAREHLSPAERDELERLKRLN